MQKNKSATSNAVENIVAAFLVVVLVLAGCQPASPIDTGTPTEDVNVELATEVLIPTDLEESQIKAFTASIPEDNIPEVAALFHDVLTVIPEMIDGLDCLSDSLEQIESIKEFNQNALDLGWKAVTNRTEFENILSDPEVIGLGRAFDEAATICGIETVNFGGSLGVSNPHVYFDQMLSCTQMIRNMPADRCGPTASDTEEGGTSNEPTDEPSPAPTRRTYEVKETFVITGTIDDDSSSENGSESSSDNDNFLYKFESLVMGGGVTGMFLTYAPTLAAGPIGGVIAGVVGGTAGLIWHYVRTHYEIVPKSPTHRCNTYVDYADGQLADVEFHLSKIQFPPTDVPNATQVDIPLECLCMFDMIEIEGQMGSFVCTDTMALKMDCIAFPYGPDDSPRPECIGLVLEEAGATPGSRDICWGVNVKCDPQHSGRLNLTYAESGPIRENLLPQCNPCGGGGGISEVQSQVCPDIDCPEDMVFMPGCFCGFPDPDDFIFCNPAEPDKCGWHWIVPMEQMSVLLTKIMEDNVEQVQMEFSESEQLQIILTDSDNTALFLDSIMYVKDGDIVLDIVENDTVVRATGQDTEWARILEDEFNDMMRCSCYVATDADYEPGKLHFYFELEVPPDECE